MIQKPHSMQSQITSMKTIWPNLKLRGKRPQTVKWVGTVRPQYCAYKIEILYEFCTHPEVRVISPVLTRLPDNEEGELPHVYPPSDNPTLCLFDPRSNEWDPSKLISETIVPWTLDWLACYEFWLMTEKWMGGGRHPDPTENTFTEVCLS